MKLGNKMTKKKSKNSLSLNWEREVLLSYRNNASNTNARINLPTIIKIAGEYIAKGINTPINIIKP